MIYSNLKSILKIIYLGLVLVNIVFHQNSTASTTIETPIEEENKMLRKALEDLYLNKEVPVSEQIRIKNLLERGGTVIGSGSQLIENNEGELVPEDLLAQDLKLVRYGQIPKSYTKEIRLENYPALKQELMAIENLLNLRVGGKGINGKNFFSIPWSHYLLFVDENLTLNDLGVDSVGSKNKVPVAITFLAGGQRIIGIKLSLFEKLSPRNQALILIHERLHHENNFDHNVINSFVKSLNTVLDLNARQQFGNFSKISEVEFKASQKLQQLIRVYDKGIGRTWPLESSEAISPVGGGIVFSLNPDWLELFLENNYVDAGSAVYLNVPKRAKTKHIPANNTISQSVLSFDYIEESSISSRCHGNSFIRSKGIEVICNGNNNILKNINSNVKTPVYGIDHFPWDFDYDRFAPTNKDDYSSRFSTLTGNHFYPAIFLDGSNNLLRDVTVTNGLYVEQDVHIDAVDFHDGTYFISGIQRLSQSSFLGENPPEGNTALFLTGPEDFNSHPSVSGLNLNFNRPVRIELKQPGIHYPFERGSYVLSKNPPFPYYRGPYGKILPPFVKNSKTLIWDLKIESAEEFKTRLRTLFEYSGESQ